VLGSFGERQHIHNSAEWDKELRNQVVFNDRRPNSEVHEVHPGSYVLRMSDLRQSTILDFHAQVAEKGDLLI